MKKTPVTVLLLLTALGRSGSVSAGELLRQLDV
jgi:hypothetical protein